jgi:hypothetical protein
MEKTKFEKTKELKIAISLIALSKVESEKFSIDADTLDLLKNNPTIIPMSKYEDICDSLGIDLEDKLNKLNLNIETKKDREIKQKEEEEKLAQIQKLLDENKEVTISLIENVIDEQDHYRDIDNTEITYYMIISTGVVDEKRIESLLSDETEFEREYGRDSGIAKLKKIGKNTFQFWQEANDDNGEFTYTYSLIESKKISSEKLVELIGKRFLSQLGNPKLHKISDDLYRALFFDVKRIAENVIPIINGIGKNEFEELINYMMKELKFCD